MKTADLQVTMSAAPNPAPVGAGVTYTITVSNLGPNLARTVTLTDTLPTTTTFVSCASTGTGVCKGSGRKRKVTFGTVNPGVSLTVTLIANVNSNVGNGVVIVNSAHIASGTTPDPSLANNHATASVTASSSPSADLSVTLSASPDTVSAEENVTFSATVTNHGPTVATNVVLTDNLPGVTSFVSCGASGGGVCGGSANARTVSFSSLAASASANVTLVAQVNAGTPEGTELPDTATVNSSTTDPVSANNVATAGPIVGGPGGHGSAADLALTLTAAPDPVFVDSTLTFTLTLRNLGPETAQSVVVTDSLPTSTQFVSCAATGAGTCGGAGNERTITFTSLAAGDSSSVTLATTVSGLLSSGTPITDRASVTSSTTDPSAANDSAAVSVIATRTQPPDVILILTDDQPRHTMDLMPQVNALIGDQGVRFTNYYVSTPICGASRANILSGRYSHNTRVFGNGNAADRFDDSSSLATWLHGAGYKTALVGKYFNNYDEISPYIAPGWDDWRVFLQTLYYDYDLNENGVIVHYGNTAADYSTTVLANHALQVIQQTPANKPLFLEVATWAPHTPATPEPSDVGAMAGLPLYEPPSFNEADVSDKPLWVRNLPLLTPQKVQDFTDFHESEGETLLAVDRAVADIVNALAQAGRLQNAVIIFTSDNGWSNGVHRWERKLCPYEECAAQPLLIRAPGLTPRNEPALASNIDLAPTIAEFAGIAPGGPVNGMSLIPLLQDPATPWRDAILLENLSGAEANMNYYAIRDPRYLYTEYANGDRELYDLLSDPFELDNQYGNPAYASIVAALQTRLQQLKAD